MLQEITLTIDTDNPIDLYKNKQVILFDKKKNMHYAVSRDTLLATQDAKIKELEETLQKKTKELAEKEKAFEEKNNKKYLEFLKTYKESNAKMIEMIKELALSKGTKE